MGVGGRPSVVGKRDVVPPCATAAPSPDAAPLTGAAEAVGRRKSPLRGAGGGSWRGMTATPRQRALLPLLTVTTVTEKGQLQWAIPARTLRAEEKRPTRADQGRGGGAGEKG